MRKHCALISVAVLALWVSLPDVAYPITVVYPDKANYVHSSVCPKGDGWNHLNPDPVKNANEYFLLDAPSNALKDELAGGDTSYAGWTFNDDSTSIYWVGYHLNGYADYGFGTDYDLHFYDFPMRYHPPASHVSWQAELYLCSWDGTTTVTFYDFGGIQWGFEAACVPEPLTVISVGLAIAAVFVRVRRRRR